jgi:predicted Zn-dependent peptidase
MAGGNAAVPRGAARVVPGAAPGVTAGKLEHRCTTLDSGLRVVSERVPAVRSVALGFWISGGSALEAEEQSGISHLLEHMLFRGTERFTSVQIDQIFDEMGSGLNAETDKEATSLSSRVLDTHLGRAFEVMSDMLWHPALRELEAEREVVLQEIASYEDDPQDQIFDRLAEVIFGEHPLGRPVIGTPAIVSGIGRDQLWSFHAQRYIPASVVIAAAGSIDHEELVAMAQAARPQSAAGDGSRQLAALSSTGRPQARSGGGDVAEPAYDRRVRFQRKDTEQYHVCIGGPGIARGDERRFALRVLEGVLGGTPSSRLFQEVRERRGLAYSVFCFSNLYASAGEVGVYVGTRPENLSEALAVIASELRRISTEAIGEDELVRSRECAKSAVVLALESSGARMSRLGSSLLWDLPILSVEEIMDRIDAVSADDCSALAGELLGGERLSVAGIGLDEDSFRRALEPLDELAEHAGLPSAV